MNNAIIIGTGKIGIDLYIKLKKCILDIEETRKFSQKKLFTSFDWKNIITKYDNLFESFIR